MKTAVISGGNGGFGRALCSALNARGWHCVLLDLNVDGLTASDRVTPMQVDLTDAAALQAAAQDIIDTRPSIDLVIYNAGITQVRAFEDSNPASHRKLFEINYFAAVNMARAFLTAVRDSQGTHLAMSSVAGFAPLKGRTAYAASKHALEGFFGSLRSEECDHGVHVAIAAPSFVATNLDNPGTAEDGTMRPGSAKDGVDYMSPEDAVRVILGGVDRKLDFIPVGKVARLSAMMMRLSPRLYQSAMRRKIAGQS